MTETQMVEMAEATEKLGRICRIFEKCQLLSDKELLALMLQMKAQEEETDDDTI